MSDRNQPQSTALPNELSRGVSAILLCLFSSPTAVHLWPHTWQTNIRPSSRITSVNSHESSSCLLVKHWPNNSQLKCSYLVCSTTVWVGSHVFLVKVQTHSSHLHFSTVIIQNVVFAVPTRGNTSTTLSTVEMLVLSMSI